METKKSLTPIYELELSDGISLKIHVKKAKKGILSIILFFALSIFFIPIIVFINFVWHVLFDKLPVPSQALPFFICIPFGFIITCIVGFLSSGYLLKLYLWNKYGTEVFIIKKKNLVLYYDYKLFKDNYKKIPFESIQVYFEDNGILMNAPQGVNVPKGNTNVNNVICFDLDGKEVKSEGEIPLEVIIKISKHLHQNR